jgi:protein-disulfide isomerase
MRSHSRFLYLAPLALGVIALYRAYAQTPDLKPEQCLGGAPDAPIRIEVFSDFECPACRQLFLETIRPVLKDYCSLDKVCVAYHEFPLQGHKYSRLAARYAKAAQKLGRTPYLAVMDALYQDQGKWSQDGSVDDVVFKTLGADQYLNLKKLLLDPSLDRIIDAEIALGQRKDVQSTPTFFIYSIAKEEKVVGVVPYPALKEFFDRIVK